MPPSRNAFIRMLYSSVCRCFSADHVDIRMLPFLCAALGPPSDVIEEFLCWNLPGPAEWWTDALLRTPQHSNFLNVNVPGPGLPSFMAGLQLPGTPES